MLLLSIVHVKRLGKIPAAQTESNTVFLPFQIGFVFNFTSPVPEKADETRAPLAIVVILNLGQTISDT